MISKGYDIIVVDSISALLEPVLNNPEKRAWLLNYFYQIPLLTNGLLVLIAELPFLEEKLALGGIEFVVDAVLILKHRVEKGFLTRILEIRKTRGAPLYIAEIPFTIVENVGIQVFAPPVLAEIPREGEEVKLVCRALGEVVDHYHMGFIVNVFFPPGVVGIHVEFLGILALSLLRKLKTLVVSYTHPPSLLRERLVNQLVETGFDRERAEKLIDEYFVITALNPFGQSTSEIYSRELSLIEVVKPNLVVFHGVHVAREMIEYKDYIRELYNELLYLKSKNILVIRIGSCIDESRCMSEASIADVTYKLELTRTDTGFDKRLIVYRRFREPCVLPGSVLDECVGEWRDLIRRVYLKS